MIQHYNKTIAFIAQKRFTLLLIATSLTLVLPAFANSSKLSDLIFVITLSFLLIQSTIVADVRKSKKNLVRICLIAIITIIWLKPAGLNSPYVEDVKLLFIALFFIFIMTFLIQFIIKSRSVNENVLLAAISVYLLAGIVGGCFAFLLYELYPNAFNFPAYITNPRFVHFQYYSFITMSTVGYGDITPRIPETQTLSYILSIAGQLYVAIVIALLIGKFLMEKDQKKATENNGIESSTQP